jgi:transposase InsO family protein
VPRYVGHIVLVPCVAVPPPLGDASIACRQWMSQRQRDDMVILAHIREQHRLSLQSYGRPRMTEELQELGLKVGHRRIGRLMRENNIKIVRTQKYKATTDSNHTFNIAPNLLDQNFSADGSPIINTAYRLPGSGAATA